MLWPRGSAKPHGRGGAGGATTPQRTGQMLHVESCGRRLVACCLPRSSGHRGKRPAPAPQSHDASRWGTSKMGTLSRWHCERASTPRKFCTRPLQPQRNGWTTNPAIHARRIPSSKGEQVRTPGSTNRHTPPSPQPPPCPFIENKDALMPCCGVHCPLFAFVCF